MKSGLVSAPVLVLVLISIAFTSIAAPKKKRAPRKPPKGPPTINKQAEQLAKAIPVYTPNSSEAAARKQVEQLIHLLSATNRDNISANTSLLSTAMDFRKDIGDHEQTITMGAIIKAWDTASAYGAIKRHHYTGYATRGRYAGEPLVIENIVSQKVLPECKGYVGNMRIVPKSLARKQGDTPDEREQAYAIGLRQVMYESKTRAAMLEREKSKVGPLGLSKAQEEARWQAAVAATGDAYTRKRPNLSLSAQKMGTPSKLNGNRYGLRVEVINQSTHPTEVQIESTIVGYTDNNNKIYELRKDTRTLKLRRSQVLNYKIQSPNVNVFKKPLVGFDPKKSQKVIYRGFTIVAKHNGEVVDMIGSDARLSRVASGDYAAPAMISKASRTGVAVETPYQAKSKN
ncbi:MAG: hypothetical protein P1U86_07990 [Verrucomicrobiales bacterium]|nr:hypothetical protein [Verrucomicrobiales bacterium]